MDDAAAEQHVRDEIEIGRVSGLLADRFHEDPSAIESAVRAEFERHSDSRIKDFVPVFVERSVRRQLCDNG